MNRYRLSLLLMLSLTACTPPVPVNESQDALWKQFGHKSVDDVLMAWGTPVAETRLTNGSRMITYRHSTMYDAQSPYEYSLGCEVTFLAKAPGYRIENIAMKGDAYECSMLAQGQTGVVQYPYAPPPIHPYYRHPFW